MIEIRRLRFGTALLGLALAAACGDPTGGPTDFLGQLRVRPAFSTGSAPGDLGVSIDSMAVEVRDEIGDVSRVDTVVAYEEGASLSWILELQSDSEPVTVQLSLMSHADTVYVGDRELIVREGSIGAAPLQDVEVRFQGASAERVEVTPGQVVLETPGSTQQFVANVYDGDGNPIGGRTFTWISSAPAVATVDDTGLATGAGNGTALIIATVAGLSDTATVTAYAIDSIVVRPEQMTLSAIGSTGQLTATAYDSNGDAVSGVDFDWTTSDPAVATVAASGLVTAIGGGTAEIAAAAGGQADTALVTVTQSVERVEVTPAQATLTALGATVQLAAAAFDGNGNVIPGASFVWTTTDPGVATVDGSGLVTAVGTGTADVVATAAGATDTAVVTVTQEVDRVEVTPADTMLLGQGARARLSATAFDARSNPIAGATFNWSSTDAAVASVDATGSVTAVEAGTARVIASSGVRADTSSITVAVRDSVTYPIDEVKIDIGEGPAERSLGVFDVPAHVAALGVAVSVEVELTFNEEVDEAFAVAVQEPAGLRFLSGGACPVVPDDPGLGRGWLAVAATNLPVGNQEFVARHGTLFNCYTPNGALEGPQSVLFVGIRFVYWRTN